MAENFILKGNIIWADEQRRMNEVENGYLVCLERKSAGVYQKLPEKYMKLPVIDHGEALIIPGMTDLHLHAPQYTFRGLGMDMELLEWLKINTFPEEAKYKNISYATSAYKIFTQDLRESFTTRACVFATIHTPATLLLMKLLEESGLITYVGRVNMDRNASESLVEETDSSLQETEEWILKAKRSFQNTRPILTPRFIPSCSDLLMTELGKLRKKYGLRVQSHLSENLSEIDWVRELVPKASTYGEAYAHFDMLGEIDLPAIMAHCVYSGSEEIALLKEKGVYIAHAPESNLNIASGIAPVKKYLEEGLRVGLSTDVAGGATLSMVHAMELSIQVSKMYWRLVDETIKPLTFSDAFYMATLGGGSYFGKVGSFQQGYEFDALVIDDGRIRSMQHFTPLQRVERMIYQEKDLVIKEKYIAGKKII